MLEIVPESAESQIPLIYLGNTHYVAKKMVAEPPRRTDKETGREKMLCYCNLGNP
jgi:hypothetical protein